MRRGRRAVALALGVAVVALAVAWSPLPAPTSASAARQSTSCRPSEERCRCSVVNGAVVCQVVSGTPGGGPPSPPPGGEQPAPSGPTTAPTAVWQSLPWWGICDPLGEGVARPDLCDTIACTTADGQVGYPYSFQLVDVATNEVLAVQDEVCAGAAGDAPAPPPPPAPPTMEQVLNAIDVPEPDIGRNPAGRGLTGLASWFWVEGATDTIAVEVTLDGWTVTGTLTADEWRWTLGDAGYTTTGPGSEADPAVEHVFQRKGDVTVTVDIAWSGSYTVSGYGTSFTVPGLTTSSSSSLDYEVVEARAVVDEP